ncbi:hypothetical protein SASPL_143358 [Salvia splendens]|uniref:Uncharacterized protein n=1 Tax=Salvia splendens TaxID=180675 RepID=A0A8X8WLG0_SALSN|nr:hypothetical protein SASPL_143358 [Salvia splendens]
MLGPIAFGLLILASSYWKLSEEAERDLEADGGGDGTSKAEPPVMEEKFLAQHDRQLDNDLDREYSLVLRTSDSLIDTCYSSRMRTLFSNRIVTQLRPRASYSSTCPLLDVVLDNRMLRTIQLIASRVLLLTSSGPLLNRLITPLDQFPPISGFFRLLYLLDQSDLVALVKRHFCTFYTCFAR